ncbi:hypothetical protein HPB50_013768 [Hyalomma asiaticum]|uniref:Uncharacterized protein n=1 Tax=Hyalomma asiaticum TaxID=266040 RepID=A0ACB7SQS1_HYAAI|nr:hypothetical protein HPB50_013768 [Hyalomma asiaticum]
MPDKARAARTDGTGRNTESLKYTTSPHMRTTRLEVKIRSNCVRKKGGPVASEPVDGSVLVVSPAINSVAVTADDREKRGTHLHLGLRMWTVPRGTGTAGLPPALGTAVCYPGCGSGVCLYCGCVKAFKRSTRFFGASQPVGFGVNGERSRLN